MSVRAVNIEELETSLRNVSKILDVSAASTSSELGHITIKLENETLFYSGDLKDVERLIRLAAPKFERGD